MKFVSAKPDSAGFYYKTTLASMSKNNDTSSGKFIKVTDQNSKAYV